MKGHRRPARYGDTLELSDKLISSFSYLTVGWVGFIWVIICAITGRRMKPFVRYNVFQSIFIGVITAIIKILFSITFNVVMIIPFINKIIGFLVFYTIQAQLIFGFSLLKFAFILLIVYLAWHAFIGRYSEIPWISKAVKQLI